MSHPSLTRAQAERLEMLIEEASEVIQAATKILRHGYESFHPNNPSMPNRNLLNKEILDFDAVRHGMIIQGDPAGHRDSQLYIRATWNEKLKWTHHQGLREGDG